VKIVKMATKGPTDGMAAMPIPAAKASPRRKLAVANGII